MTIEIVIGGQRYWLRVTNTKAQVRYVKCLK